MSASFSRAKRRRIVELQEQINICVEADGRFFERHVSRNHRLRHASRAEVALLGEVHGLEEVRLPPGERWYCVVRQLDAATGTRTRLYAANDDGIDTDLSEPECRWIYDRIAGGNTNVAKVENTIRGVIDRWRKDR